MFDCVQGIHPITYIQACMSTNNNMTSIASLEQRIALLESDNRNLQTTNTLLNNSLQTYVQQQQLMQNYQHTIQSRMQFLVNWFKFVNNVLQSQVSQGVSINTSRPYISGTCLRKMFELLLNPQQIHTNDWYGNLSASDDMVCFLSDSLFHHNDLNHHKDDDTDKVYCTIRFMNFLNYFHRLFQQQNHIDTKYFFFAGYKLENIMEAVHSSSQSYIPPYFILYFTKLKLSTNEMVVDKKNLYADSFKLVVYAWSFKNYMDFSVNAIKFDHNGFSSLCNTNTNVINECQFVDVLDHIQHSHVKYVRKPETHQNDAFPTNSSLNRKLKTFHLNQLYELISERLINVMESGYNLIGRQPIMKVEVNDDCAITGCKAPYPCVQLQCNHFISIMAYKGLISLSGANNERLSCPLCRNVLFIKFQYVKESCTSQPIYEDINQLSRNFNNVIYNQQQDQLKHKFISKDALENL